MRSNATRLRSSTPRGVAVARCAPVPEASKPEATRRGLLDNGWFVVSLLALFAAALYGAIVVRVLVGGSVPAAPAIEAETARDYPIRSGDSGPP